MFNSAFFSSFLTNFLGTGTWDEVEYLLKLTGVDYGISVEEKRKKKLIHREEKMDTEEGVLSKNFTRGT